MVVGQQFVESIRISEIRRKEKQTNGISYWTRIQCNIVLACSAQHNWKPSKWLLSECIAWRSNTHTLCMWLRTVWMSRVCVCVCRMATCFAYLQMLSSYIAVPTIIARITFLFICSRRPSQSHRPNHYFTFVFVFDFSDFSLSTHISWRLSTSSRFGPMSDFGWIENETNRRTQHSNTSLLIVLRHRKHRISIWFSLRIERREREMKHNSETDDDVKRTLRYNSFSSFE